MKELLKKSQILVFVVRTVRKFFGIDSMKLSMSYHVKNDPIYITQYYRDHLVRKLHIGCQGKILQGWLNVDLDPKREDVVMLDATKTFSFPDQSFDYIYTEHMIEHIPFSDALFMIKECWRVLKKGGKIRISTPNLNAVVNVFLNPEQPEHMRYINHYREHFLDKSYPNDATFVLNKMFYGFGHRFIHNESSLRWLLQNAGFMKVSLLSVGQSDDSNLKNLEMHGIDLGDANNRIESIIIQAEK